MLARHSVTKKTLQTSIVEPQNGASFQSMDVTRALFNNTE